MLDRLDVFTRFLIPAQRQPRRIRTAETTELMLQLVANGRGVCVVPDWILRQDGADLPLRALRRTLSRSGPDTSQSPASRRARLA